MKSFFRSAWLWIAACVIVLMQLAAVLLVLAGVLEGSAQNLSAQVVIGGTGLLLLLGLGALRFGDVGYSPIASRLALYGLTAVALAGVALYLYRVAPFLSLPVDLAGWSEPMFMMDIVKWHTGAPLYLPAEESNSNPYTFGAPMVSYALAALVGRADSIAAYRVLLQSYLVVAACLTGWTAWRLISVADPGRSDTKLWLAFFVFVSFLFATNDRTNYFVTFLHNDPLALLATAVAFWLMVEHARTKNDGWLVAMALMPTIGFLVKQYVVLWIVIYPLYLWLDGTYSRRRILSFATTSFGTLIVVLGVCYAAWGAAFRYWVFEVLGSHAVSYSRILEQFTRAAIFLLPGCLAAGLLVERKRRERLLGIWVAWPILVLGATYSTGITYQPTHLGPATLVGGCLFLTAFATLFWPQGHGNAPDDAWPRLGLAVGGMVVLFLAWGVLVPKHAPVSPDLQRYVGDIEREFQGYPVGKVFLDSGEWIYLRLGRLERNRLQILNSHHSTAEDLKRRVREQEYDRILVRLAAPNQFAYDAGTYDTGGVRRGVREEMLRYYREVRRIPRVRGMEQWAYQDRMLSEIVVLEPVPR